MSRPPDLQIPDRQNPGSAKTTLNGRGGRSETVFSTRPSRGLEEFFVQIRDTTGLTILDWGGATQKNVSFITDLGHRLYSEDFLQCSGETFGADDTVDQSNPGRIEYFLKQTLDYPEGHLDGVLVWDVLEYLSPALLNAVVERLHKIVRPKATCWPSSTRTTNSTPCLSTRSASTRLNSLEVLQQGMRRPAQLFNNRSLENCLEDSRA